MTTKTTTIHDRVQYELDHLSPTELAQIEHNREMATKLGSGSHLADWLSLGPGLMTQRRKAMRASNSNSPNGRRYSDAINEMLALDGFDTRDKKLMRELSAVLFIVSDPENQSWLTDALLEMSPSRRMQITLPTTARVMIIKANKARSGEVIAEPKRVSRITRLEDEVKNRDDRIADLEEKLASSDGGSLFDLKKTSAAGIAKVIVGNVGVSLSRKKAREIANEIIRQLDEGDGGDEPEPTPTKPKKPRAKPKPKKLTDEEIKSALADAVGNIFSGPAFRKDAFKKKDDEQ